MKKQKQSASKQTPIQLSANKKSHSINLRTKQQPLFAPHKIQWKSPGNDNLFSGVNPSIPMKQPLRNIQNSNSHCTATNNSTVTTSSNKAFYHTIKSELMNIKEDVEKLIMKEKTPRNEFSGRKDSFSSIHNQPNGCIKSISIKNKCQQKMTRIESLYEDVDKILANKVGDTTPSSKFSVGQLRLDHRFMHNVVRDQVTNMESKYRSEKEGYVKTKSRSIADAFSILPNTQIHNLVEDMKDPRSNLLMEAIGQKQLGKETELNQEQDDSPVRQKIQVQIKLPSFDKPKNEEKRPQTQKDELISKLQTELNQLQKQLQFRNDLMSKKQQTKFKLTQQIETLKNQLQTKNIKLILLQQKAIQSQTQLQTKTKQLESIFQQKKLQYETELQAKRLNIQRQAKQLRQNYEGQIDHLRHLNFDQQSKLNFLEEELQKAIHAIRQKEQQNSHLLQSLNSQNTTIQQISAACQQLVSQVNSMKESVQESKKIKEKLRLKENQLYIYQEELKEAKSKIKSLKENNHQTNSQLQEQQATIQSLKDLQKVNEQTKSLNTQLKECLKINQALKQENDRLNKEINSIKQINSDNQGKIKEFLKQNCQMKQKICEMEKDAQKALQQLMSNQGFQSIGEQISRKLSTMIDENYQLKNKISHLESTVEQITLRNRSLTQEVSIYEQKVSLQKDCTRRLKIQDWDNLTDERDSLKLQLEKTIERLQETKEFYELQTMKKQNLIYELKEQISGMLEDQQENEQQIHPNIRSVKHIKNLDVLLNEFKDMIQLNLEMREENNKLKQRAR